MNGTPSRKIRLWDAPLRLFHWLLLISVGGAIACVELAEQIDNGMEWHKRFGFAVLALLLFRLIWGFVGGTHARFTSFVRGPAAILAYLKTAKSNPRPSLGHNPLGALSVLAILATLIFQAVSGLFITDEVLLEGPLFKYVSESTASLLGKLHEANAAIIFTLIGLHLAAILFYRFVKRDDLVTPMLTGNKTIPTELAAEEAKGGSLFLGLAALAVAVAVVWYVVTKL